MLREAGIAVVEAADGQEALQRMAEHPEVTIGPPLLEQPLDRRRTIDLPLRRERIEHSRRAGDPGPLPAKDEDIAYAPVTKLSRWIEQRKLTSERLTQIYFRRIGQYDAKLRCVITLTKDLALEQAKQADAEIAGGKYRGPLHGIPWGGKDLLDTAGIPTT